MTEKNRDQKLNKGSALITVLVVITVLMAIVLSVLQLSYRYYITENGGLYRQKCKEAAQSLSEEIKKELTKPNFTDYDEQNDKAPEIWKYVRNNMYQDGWKYETEAAPALLYSGDENPFKSYEIDKFLKTSDSDVCKKEFSLIMDEGRILGDKAVISEETPRVLVSLYYEPGKYKNIPDGTRLYVKTECIAGDYSYSITNTFTLFTVKYNCPAGEETTKVDAGGGEIFKNHKWMWKYENKL